MSGAAVTAADQTANTERHGWKQQNPAFGLQQPQHRRGLGRTEASQARNGVRDPKGRCWWLPGTAKRRGFVPRAERRRRVQQSKWACGCRKRFSIGVRQSLTKTDLLLGFAFCFVFISALPKPSEKKKSTRFRHISHGVIGELPFLFCTHRLLSSPGGALTEEQACGPVESWLWTSSPFFSCATRPLPPPPGVDKVR